jgi:hypothetical protein
MNKIKSPARLFEVLLVDFYHALTLPDTDGKTSATSSSRRSKHERVYKLPTALPSAQAITTPCVSCWPLSYSAAYYKTGLGQGGGVGIDRKVDCNRKEKEE